MSFSGGVMKLYNKIHNWPMGNHIFSMAFSVFAPYFSTIRPHVEHLAPGQAIVSMKQRWIVQNHIKTVHAIAVCNLVEMAMGLVAESSIPSHLRWLPMGMNVDYLKKATGQLTAETNIDHTTFFHLDKYPGKVEVPVIVKNVNGDIVTTAEVRLWISEKPASLKSKS
jgi:acyl-coenzyme A thioesterase PaaI-like protein